MKNVISTKNKSEASTAKRPPYLRRTERTEAAQPTFAKLFEIDLITTFNKSEANDETAAEAGEEELDLPEIEDIPAFIGPDAEEMNSRTNL